MREHFNKALFHASGLMRTRVVVCCIGLWVVTKHPEAGQWIAAIIGATVGVSAVDAFRGDRQ